MKKKYFFFDIDGTLTFNRGLSVAPHTMECLAQLRQNGHEIFLASGRLQRDVAEMAQRFGIDSFVADGGNSVTLKNHILFMHPLPRQACIEFLDQLQEKNIPWGVVTHNDKVRYARDERVLQATRGSFFQNVIQPDFDYHQAPQFYKIFVGCTPEEEYRIDFGSLPVVRFNPLSLYIEPEDKANGIRALMRAIQAPLKDVVVFGDGTNDVKMFTREWFCIAMGNAREVLKEKADYITLDCEQDGIYHACQYFGWIG